MKIFIPAFGRVNTQNRDGGAVRFIELAKRWQSSGVELNLLISKREVTVMQNEGLDAEFSVLPEWIYSERDTLWNVSLVYFTRLLQSFIYRCKDKFDIIYSPSDFIGDVVSGVMAKRKNPDAKFVICIFLIAPNPFIGYKNVWRKGWRIPTIRGLFFYALQKAAIYLCRIYADKIFVLNELDKIFLEKNGLTGKVYVANMGVSLNEVSKIQPNSGVCFDGIFLGRLHPQKGIDDLIKIWRYVCDKKQDARLGIIGGGDKLAFRRLDSQIKAAGCNGNIEVLGFRMGEEKFSLLKSSKVFLMPSYYESWGLVILEAMACGLPVVTYNLPIYKEKFSKGLITVKIGDVSNFAENVLTILEDKTYYNRLQKEVSQAASVYNWDYIAKHELDVIRN